MHPATEPSRPPRSILIVHNRYRQAGGEDTVVAAETALLTSRGHRVERFTVDNADLADPAGIRGRVRLARETIWADQAARRVADAARAAGAEIVHIHNFLPQLSPAVHGAARSTGAAVVQTLHNYRLVCPAATLLRDGRVCEDCVALPIAIPAVVHGCYGSRAQSAAVTAMLAVHRVRRTWVRDVDGFIALTPFAARVLGSGGLPRSRIHVKPNFVDVASSPDPTGRAGFLFVGRLAPEKGIDTLLEAWKLASLPTTLRIVGDGPLRTQVEAAAAADPSVRFDGGLDRTGVADAMERASALVVPSIWYEGMPLTIVEAFASALPVIGSDLGAMADMIDDGRTGRLVPPGDAAALAGTLRAMHGDPEANAIQGRAARAEYEQRYSGDVNYPRLLAIYGLALEHRAAATTG